MKLVESPNAKLTLKMQCKDCGHIQTVKGRRLDGVNYFGSSYNWCDECDKGLPIAIEVPKVLESKE